MVQFCPKCGTNIPDDEALFCNKCGNKLPVIPPKKKELVCPTCRTKIVNEQSQYCDRCGTSLFNKIPPKVVTPQGSNIFSAKTCPSCGIPIDNADRFYCKSCGEYLKKPTPSTKTEDSNGTSNDTRSRQVKIFGKQKITREQFESYKPNWILILSFAVGLISIILPWLLVIIVITSAIMVYYDAKKIRAGTQVHTESTMNSRSWSPFSWGLFVLLLWIIALPLYLYNRRDIFFENYDQSTAGNSYDRESFVSTRASSYEAKNFDIPSEEKSPFIASLCSFFIPGLGQVYNGETAKGVGVFFGTLIGVFLFFIPGLICWIYGIYDAYFTAKKMNLGEVIFKSTKTAHLILFIILVIFITAVVAFFAFVMAFSQFYNYNSAISSPSSSTIVTSSVTSSAISSSSGTHQTSQQSSVPTNVDLTIGQSASNPVKQVTVYSARKTSSYDWTGSSLSYTFTNNAKSGKEFILVDAEVKNLGTDSLYASSGDFSIDDSEGNRYDPESYSGDDSLGYLKELYQNQKVRGKVVFEVPEDATGLKLYYNFGNVFSGTKLASWTIN